MEKSVVKHTVTAKNTGGEIETEVTVTVQHTAPTGLKYKACKWTVGVEAEVAGTVAAKGAVVVYSLHDFKTKRSNDAWFSAGGGTLPDGMSFDEMTGIVSGTPTTPLANSTLTIKAANSGGEVSTTLSIDIKDAPPTKLTYTPILATATVGILSGGEAPAVKPEGAPTTFSIEPVLPEGLEFDTDTGVVTGTPASNSVGETSHVVTVTNTGGSTSTELPVEINNVPPSGLAYGDNNLNMLLHSPAEFAAEFECEEGSFSIQPKLPAGLVLDKLFGDISGIVTDKELFNTSSKHVVTLTNNGGSTSVEITFSFKNPEREFYELIDANEADYIKDLAKAVSIESVNNGNGCNKADDLFKWLDGYIGKIKKYKSKPNIDTVDLGSGIKGLYFHPGAQDAGAAAEGGEQASTLCVYGHLDTKDPMEQGKTEWDKKVFVLSEGESAFGPVLDGIGVVDSKGPLVAWLSAANAYCELGRAFPVGLKFVIDTNGLGSSTTVLESEPVKEWLADVDHICVAESTWLTQDKPCVTYGLRGTMHFTVTVKGGKKNLRAYRSGTMNQVMTDISTAMNAVTQPEFLEALRDSAADDECYDDITWDREMHKSQLGIEGKLLQADKSSCLNAWWNHPAVSVHGVEVSAAASARKMPSEASFTFSVRTAPGMVSAAVTEAVTKQVNEALAQSPNQSSITMDCQVDPFLADNKEASYTAACGAVQQVYQREADLIRNGGTLAAVVALEKISKKNVCIFPIGSSMKPGGPESLRKKCFKEGIKVYGRYMEALGPKVESPMAASHKKRVGAIFDEMDTNMSGSVSQRQFEDWANKNEERVNVFFSFLAPDPILGPLEFHSEECPGIEIFWMKAVWANANPNVLLADMLSIADDNFDFSEPDDMNLDRDEFCVLYNRLTA